MASTLVDLVKISANSTGSGAISLGSPVAGYRGHEALTNGAVYSYSIQDGDAWEFGRGTFLSETRQLTRTPEDSSDGGAAINLRQNAQVSFVALSLDLDAVQLSNDALSAAAQTQADAAQTAADRAFVEAGTQLVVNGEAVYPHDYASVVPKGVTSLTNDGVGTGSGGSPGTYAGGVTDGPVGFAWTYTIGGDGKISSYQITSPGVSTVDDLPTLSYPDGGITGATAPEVTVSERIPQGGNYWAVSADGTTLDLYSNVGGSPSPVLDPEGEQVRVISSGGANLVVAQAEAWAVASAASSAASEEYSDSASDYTTILSNYTLGIRYDSAAEGVDPDTGVADGRSYEVLTGGRIFGYRNNGGTPEGPLYEIATAVSSGTAPGAIGYFALSSAPTGWLKANGAAISRTTYALLFAAIGTDFGAGDGTTTFNLPDARGEFFRALDDGRGVDTGRVLGSAQGSQNLFHHHKSPGASSSASGDYEVAPPVSLTAGGVQVGGFASYDYTGGGPESVASYTDNDGGSEARPRNIAWLACIKY